MGISNFQLTNLEIYFLITAIFSVLVAAFGIFYSSYMNRKLQKKQLAIKLLHENRFEKIWVDSLRLTMNSIDKYDEYYFKRIAENHINIEDTLTKGKEEIRTSIQLVLNTLEFISISIINKAISEEIIIWSYGIIFCKCYDSFYLYIIEFRKKPGNEGAYINFTNLVERWHPDKKTRINNFTPCIAKPSW